MARRTARGDVLARLLDIGGDPDDEPDLRVRKRTAVAAVLAFMAVAVVLGLANAALGRSPQVALALSLFVAFGIALLIFRRTRRLAPLVVTMSAVGLAVLFLSLIPTGGLSWGASNLIWIILVPMAAVLFLGAHVAVPALAAIVVTVAAAVVLDPILQSPPPDPTLARVVFVAVNILGPATIALGLVVYIDGERVRAKAQSEALLLNVLPQPIADRLKHGERVIADHHDEVTALFADLVEFTPFAARESAARVVAVLNEIFSGFDSLAERFGLEKIKTIGDGYMVVAGAPEARADHAGVILEMALEMHALAGRVEVTPGRTLQLRTGVASGPAVAGVIGHRKFSYDIWGDAVNLASRMESTGLPGKIQVASSTWQLCRDRYPFTARDLEVKGLGPLRTYLLDPSTVGPRAGDVIEAVNPAFGDRQPADMGIGSSEQ
jgi:guanylate cyclase